jgi:uncharacterized membrane protein YgdD (TMEM256/DUF423 family)
MECIFVILGSLSGLIAVAGGAFGAHTLRDRISAAQLALLKLAPAIKCTTRWRCWQPPGPQLAGRAP